MPVSCVCQANNPPTWSLKQGRVDTSDPNAYSYYYKTKNTAFISNNIYILTYIDNFIYKKKFFVIVFCKTKKILGFLLNTNIYLKIKERKKERKNQTILFVPEGQQKPLVKY